MSGNSRSHPFPGMKASDSLPEFAISEAGTGNWKIVTYINQISNPFSFQHHSYSISGQNSFSRTIFFKCLLYTFKHCIFSLHYCVRPSPGKIPSDSHSQNVGMDLYSLPFPNFGSAIIHSHSRSRTPKSHFRPPLVGMIGNDTFSLLKKRCSQEKQRRVY